MYIKLTVYKINLTEKKSYELTPESCLKISKNKRFFFLFFFLSYRSGLIGSEIEHFLRHSISMTFLIHAIEKKVESVFEISSTNVLKLVSDSKPEYAPLSVEKKPEYRFWFRSCKST